MTSSSQPIHIGLLAGEASGDLLGGGLITALRQTFPFLSCSGIGGPAMQSAGFESRHPMERLSVMGIIDPLKRLPELIRIRRDIVQYFLRERPRIFIGIDSPDFNLGLEIILREAGIPVIHYVSPSVWAWRQRRVFKIARAADEVLTLFPFEADFYHRHNIPARFVGHPLADRISPENDKKAARIALGIDPDAMCLALLPGSRESECRHMFPLFLATAGFCQKQHPTLCIISASADDVRHAELQAIARQHFPRLKVHIFRQAAQQIMLAADVVLVTSGTATLETMLCGRPMVIAYRMSSLIYPLIRPLIKIPWIGLPNLLAGEKIVPEFIQAEATPTHLAEALLEFFNEPEKIMQLQIRFKALHHQLKCGADQQAANAVIELINRKPA